MFPTRLLRAQPSKPNITGFDIKKLAAASGQPPNDPWRRAEAWRYEGQFTRWNRFKGALPGLGTAIVLFAGYCVYEELFMKKEEHHGEDHGEAHH